MSDSDTAALTWMALTTLANSSSETHKDLDEIRELLELSHFCSGFDASTRLGAADCQLAEWGNRPNACQVVGDSCIPR